MTKKKQPELQDIQGVLTVGDLRAFLDELEENGVIHIRELSFRKSGREGYSLSVECPAKPGRKRPSVGSTLHTKDLAPEEIRKELTDTATRVAHAMHLQWKGMGT